MSELSIIERSDGRKIKKENNNIYFDRVVERLKNFKNRELLHEKIIDRLILLERETKFNEDSHKIRIGMNKVFNRLEKKHSGIIFDKNQRTDAEMAAVLHDIGKSGPANSTIDEQKVIVRIFSLENIGGSKRRPEDINLDEILTKIFDENEMDAVNEFFEKLNLSPKKTTMRDFYDKHAQWTHDILEKYAQNLNKNIRIIAGSHHIDHNINPYALNESEIPVEANIIGALESYEDALEERVLIAMDHYEASVRRGNLKHEKAMDYLKSNLKESSVFKKDELMNWVIDVIDELGKEQDIFAEN